MNKLPTPDHIFYIYSKWIYYEYTMKWYRTNITKKYSIHVVYWIIYQSEANDKNQPLNPQP